MMTVTGWNEGHRADGKKVGSSCPFRQLSSHPVLVLGRKLGTLLGPGPAQRIFGRPVTLLLVSSSMS